MMYNEGTRGKASGDRPESWERLIQQPTSSGGFVERYYDPGLALSELETKDSLISREVERIQIALTVVGVVGSIPRRLGGEATDLELAIDKKRARRVEHALRQAFSSWSKRDPKIQVTAAIQKEGIQLEWIEFVPAHLTQIYSELCLVATWSILSDEARWGRSAVVSLENEMRWITYAMRD
jgi:hypothetical protein